MGIAGLTQMQVSKMKSEWYDKIEVTIYMCAINDAAPNCNATEASDAQIDAVRQKIASARRGNSRILSCFPIDAMH